MKLTVKQKQFCLEYAKSGNATQAAIKAGYSKNTARTQGTENLAKPAIKQELARLAEKTKAKTERDIMDAAEMQETLTKIIRQQATEENIVIEGIGDGCSEARKIDKTPSFKDIVSAIDKLARMQGAYNDKVEVSGAVPIVLCDDIKADNDS